jgi:hypothetical protein
MQVYHCTHPIGSSKTFHLYKRSGLFVFLTGFNIETDHTEKVSVYPVYRPLIAWQNLDGQFILELFAGKKSLLVSFSARGIEIGLEEPAFPVSE